MGGRSICNMCYETRLLNEMLSLILFVVYNNTLLGTFQNLITHHERTNDIAPSIESPNNGRLKIAFNCGIGS
jgi:hypothetical protein